MPISPIKDYALNVDDSKDEWKALGLIPPCYMGYSQYSYDSDSSSIFASQTEEHPKNEVSWYVLAYHFLDKGKLQ